MRNGPASRPGSPPPGRRWPPRSSGGARRTSPPGRIGAGTSTCDERDQQGTGRGRGRAARACGPAMPAAPARSSAPPCNASIPRTRRKGPARSPSWRPHDADRHHGGQAGPGQGITAGVLVIQAGQIGRHDRLLGVSTPSPRRPHDNLTRPRSLRHHPPRQLAITGGLALHQEAGAEDLGRRPDAEQRRRAPCRRSTAPPARPAGSAASPAASASGTGWPSGTATGPPTGCSRDSSGSPSRRRSETSTAA